MKTYKVALVEDNADHIYLIRKLLERYDEVSEVRVYETAEASLEDLAPSGGDCIFCPDFMLLDLKLPGMSGQELLSRLQGSDAVKGMLIFVLTSSDRLSDRRQCETLGAMGYFLKPLTDEDMMKVFLRMENVAAACQPENS